MVTNYLNFDMEHTEFRLSSAVDDRRMVENKLWSTEED